MHLKKIGAGAVLVAMIGTGAAVYAAVANPETAPPPPSSTTWTEDEWTLETPAGWRRADITERSDGVKAIRYRADDGRYFIVAIDPLGSGYDYDVLWQYEVAGRGFTIVERETNADAAQDGRFDGYALWETGSDPEKVGGHVFVFMFGDADSPAADTAVFEEILDSVRVA